MSSKVAAIAKLTAAEGQRDALVKVMDQLVDAAEKEAGTELYVLNLDAKNPDVIWFYELYTDNDALSAHSGSDTMKAIGSQLGGLIAGAPELNFLTPHRAAGVDL
jgi:quinol monooxygenase YgiN